MCWRCGAQGTSYRCSIAITGRKTQEFHALSKLNSKMDNMSAYKIKLCYLGATIVVRDYQGKPLGLEGIDNDELEDLNIVFGNLSVKPLRNAEVYTRIFNKISSHLAEA